MPPEIVEYLAELVRRVHEELGRRLSGVWLAGSAALGDFDPARSDVDVQAVTTARLPRPELERVAAALSHPALRCPVRGLEFVLYAREDVPAFQLNLNTGPGVEQHAGYDPGAEPRFWFVLDIAIAHEHAWPLAGLAPAQLLPEPPRAKVIEALSDSLAWFRAHDRTAAVLAGCRAWAWAEEGRWLSKRDAAAWAAIRLTDATPVARAIAHRGDPSAPQLTPREVAIALDPAERSLALRRAALASGSNAMKDRRRPTLPGA